jgi:hypothetical protein
MAYRRRSGDLSQAKRLRRKGQEERKVTQALDEIQLAQQHEARDRQDALQGGGGLGFLIPAILGVTNPAALAAYIALGKGVGDIAYQSEWLGDNDAIKDAVDRLENLKGDVIFKDAKEAIDRGVLEGDIAQEQIAGEHGWDELLLQSGTDFMTNYALLSGLDKIGGADGGSLEKISDKLRFWSA